MPRYNKSLVIWIYLRKCEVIKKGMQYIKVITWRKLGRLTVQQWVECKSQTLCWILAAWLYAPPVIYYCEALMRDSFFFFLGHFFFFFINLAETCKCFPEEWFITMLLGCIQSSTNLPNVWTAWNSSPHLASSRSPPFIRLSIDFNCWGAGGGWALRDGWSAGSGDRSHLYLFGGVHV